MTTDSYDLEDDGLFDPLVPNASNLLRDRYGTPPFSVLPRNGRDWLDRDNRWRSLGIQSEVGRDVKTYNMNMDYARPDGLPIGDPNRTSQTSTFSPTLCELVYRWLSRSGQAVLDPFAGGSVRGVVAGAMGREYVGIELRPEQVAANEPQATIATDGGGVAPTWITGDSAAMRELLPPDFRADLVFSCPPYAHLEKYSDHPADLSGMDYPAFLATYRDIIAEAGRVLRDDRFAAWVVGEVRDKSGNYVGLVPDTIRAFQDAGFGYYNRCILPTPIGTAAVRTPKQFDVSRKFGNVHEVLLMFVKGDPRKATAAADGGGVA